MKKEIEFGIIDIDNIIDPNLQHRLTWLNRLTIRKMEKHMRKAGAIPFYYGFASFNCDGVADDETVVFVAWPFYYKYSHRFRRRQMRHRLGRWIRDNIIIRLMK